MAHTMSEVLGKREKLEEFVNKVTKVGNGNDPQLARNRLSPSCSHTSSSKTCNSYPSVLATKTTLSQHVGSGNWLCVVMYGI
jgi:hypothetical protein